jgi:DNA-binding beta-propeller fold protein YncE
MTQRLLAGCRRLAYLAALSALLSGLLACGGSGTDIGDPDPPSSGYLYIASLDSQNQQMPGAVYQYTINSDGSLTPMSIASVPTGAAPTAMVSDATGHYVYVLNRGDGSISQYAVGAGGQLSPLSPAVVAAAGALSPGTGTWSMTADPSGHFLYAVLGSEGISGPPTLIVQFTIGSTGALSPLNPPVVTVQSFGSASMAIDPSGLYAYLPGSTGSVGGQVSQFAIGADGALQALTPAAVTATPGARGLTIAPDDQTAYVLSSCIDTNCDGQVALYTLGANGQLTAAGMTLLTGGHVNPLQLIVDGAGSSAYLLTDFMGVDTNTSGLHQYAISSAGALTPESPASLQVTSGPLGERSSGSNLYVLSNNHLAQVSGGPSGGHVDHYTIGSSGLLTLAGTTTVTADSPVAMALVVPTD